MEPAPIDSGSSRNDENIRRVVMMNDDNRQRVGSVEYHHAGEGYFARRRAVAVCRVCPMTDDAAQRIGRYAGRGQYANDGVECRAMDNLTISANWKRGLDCVGGITQNAAVCYYRLVTDQSASNQG